MISFGRAAAEEGDLSLPVGFRFRPTDEELVDYYLKNKVQGTDFHAEGIIDEIDILKFEPWDLVAKSLMKPDDENGFFFSQPETRDMRRTVIGKKRILTFYIGHGRNSDKTDWVMHEYYIPKAHANQRDFVLCHCHLKKNVKKSDEIHTDVATTCDEGEPSTHNASDFEHPPAHDILEEYVDYNALQPAFAANDSDVEFAEFLETVLVEPDGGVTSDTDMEPFHGHGQAEMLSEVFYGSSLPSRDTGGIFRNQISPQAASSVNVAPKPQTDRVQLKSDTSQGARGPRHQPGPIIDTSADEYYTKEKTRRRTNPPAKPKQPAYRRTAADLPQKQISLTNSSQDKKVAQGKNAEKGMEQTQNRTTVSNWKGSFITWQTPSLTTSPPSAYISNIFLGLSLFYFCVREVVLFGEWS
ncbi:unnamed protein product [Prunus armeniaca]|uniref:NAC domain-containing protein n=1 Tax=Prunus armeniaca TaxID=36596 RepID=A0A6J5WL71_PRUAR|nr:unnamed protein product [Prunus armeniaca]CAB4300815.1 unnamed protein product [Prunus armeniaca]